MRKLHLAVCLLLILASVPCVNAWAWVTHYDIVEAAFNALPENVRDNLSFTLIKRGSVAPDNEDFGHPHRYSNTVMNASAWLEQAKIDYFEGRYDNASYDLGVAAHFISDSTVVPYHNVYPLQDFDLHDEYESIGSGVEAAPPSYIQNFDLEEMLSEFNQDSLNRLNGWINAGNDQKLQMVKEDVDRAATYTYNAWVQTLEIEVQVSESSSFLIDGRLIAAIILAVLVIIIVIYGRRPRKSANVADLFLYTSG